jgi:hypothetical protein
MKSDAQTFPGAPRWGDVIAVAATAGLHLLCKHMGAHFPFVIAAVVFWTAFVLYRAWKKASLLSEWGFGRENFAAAFLRTTILAIPLVGLMALAAWPSSPCTFGTATCGPSGCTTAGWERPSTSGSSGAIPGWRCSRTSPAAEPPERR